MTDQYEHLKFMAKTRPGGDGEAARWAVEEIENLRQQFFGGVLNLLGQVKEQRQIVVDANERMDKAGLPR